MTVLANGGNQSLIMDRRSLMRGAATLAVMLGAGGVLSACGGGAGEGSSPTADPSAPPDMAKAREEGLVLWHCNQDPDVTEFLKGFTEKTGVPATASRILPGTGLPKLDQEFKAKKPPTADVYDISDVGLIDQLREQGRIMQYQSSELSAYQGAYVSTPPGYWTTYFINPQPMMYRTDRVSKQDAPKTYEDLLDPKWKGRICFQDATSGSAYNWWYQLRGLLPADYFDKLAAQEPSGYESSTQMLQDINSGQMLIAGFMSNYQYPGAISDGIPLEMVYPEIGTPTLNNAAGIIANTQHPNAAKAYIDYLISKDGQENWTLASSSVSPRTDVPVAKGLPAIDSFKVLISGGQEGGGDELAKFAASETHTEFVQVWNRVLGVQ